MDVELNPPESPAAFVRRTWWVWAGLAAAYAVVAANLPPMDDEVYYWSWSKTPQLSYYDHPGMTAWLIRLSTQIFGDTVLGMRFPACCCTAATLAVIAYLTSRSAAGMIASPWPQRGPFSPVGEKVPEGRMRGSRADGGSTSLQPGEQSPPHPDPLPRSGGEGTGRGGIHPLMLGVALTPLFTFGGILITPDAPLIACWSLYLLWLVMLHGALANANVSHVGWKWWLVGGILLGLGGLSKYTMILAVPAGFASFLLSGVPWRKWFWGYVAHGVVSVCVASPILLYNVQRDFEPILFQWRHAMHDEPATPITFLEFFGVQLLLFGTLPFYLVPWTIRHLLFGFSPLSPGGRGAEGEGDVTDVVAAEEARRASEGRSFVVPRWRVGLPDHIAVSSPSSGRSGRVLPPGEKEKAGSPDSTIPAVALRSPRLRVCSCLYLLPLAFFLYKAARTELEGNWGLVAFLSVWPVAAAWYETVRASRGWRWATAASFLPPLICVVGLTVHLVSPLPLIPAQHDRLSKQRGRWDMIQQMAETIRARGESIPTFSHTYQLTALLKFWGVDARQEGTARPSHYTFPPQHMTDVPAAYLVTEPLAEPFAIEGFDEPERIGTFPTVVRGETVHEYVLWKYERR